MAAQKGPPQRIAVQNRKARHDYEILEKFEAGIVLRGSEVKSLRAGHGNISDAYAQEAGGEMYLLNAHIPRYDPVGRDNHEPMRPRKLLSHRRESNRLTAQIATRGITIVPLSINFDHHGRAKVQLGLGRGKKAHDKRAAKKEQDWRREQGRLLRDKG